MNATAYCINYSELINCNKNFSFTTVNCSVLYNIPYSCRKRLGYVRNPRSLMEGTETLCRDDIGDLPGSPNHL